jgi:predicted ATPase/DNA-binding CsgD family transcriptional regulator
MPSLPAQPGPLIGRASELAFVGNRLAQGDARLVTLTGPAGTGKTRLALEVASQVADRFVDGTFFVDLAPVSDSAMVASAVAQVLEIREEGDRPLLEVLAERLAAREMLLVLDNFEQVLPAAFQLSEILQSCAGLKLLVTSRSALRLRWEQVIPVAPLAVPNLTTLPEPKELAGVASVELYVQRAQRADPQFSLGEANASAVAAICVRLDGLPLALELAAARSRVLPPRALLSRLEHRLDVLATTSADQPARQRTLRGALDWSYDLLSPAEQAIFRRLGVFVGGFPLGAVAEVCDPEGSLSLDALSAIESLVDNSLIRRERPAAAAASDEPRFSMLETVREYALERLRESGETELTRRRHARYYLLGADVPVAEMKMAQQSVWLQMLDAEHDNLRTALAWCEEAGEPELGLSAASLLAWFWTVRGHVTEGRRRLAALLNLAAHAPAALRAEALRVMGSLALHQSDYPRAQALFLQCLTIRRELGDPAGLLSPLTGLGAVATQLGELRQAETYFEGALSIQTALEDKLGMAESLNNLANIAHDAGDLARARQLYERSLMVQQVNAIRYRPDVVAHNLGVIALEQGDLSGARRYLEDSVAVRRALGDTAGLALSLAKLGEVLSNMGDAAAAHRLLCESLTLQRELGDRAGMAFVLERFGMAAASRGMPTRALRMVAAAESLREAIGTPLAPAARPGYDRWLSSVRETLRPEEVGALWRAAQALSLDQVLAEALQPQPTDRLPVARADAILSAREREVAALVAQGLTNRDIAERLVVSERTAENHVQHVLNRLGLRSRAQVAAWAVQNGLLARQDGTC